MRVEKRVRYYRSWLRMAAGSAAVALASISASGVAQDQPAAKPAEAPPAVTVAWDKVLRESKTTATMLTVVVPQFRPGSPLRKPSYDAVAALDSKYIRFVPWTTSPRMSVAELDPPTAKGTSWNFKEIDPQVVPFLEATKGREPVMNFSVIPRWMFKGAAEVEIPKDPNKLVWNYSNIAGVPFGGEGLDIELTDPSGKQIGDYFARVVSWYSKGGFTDEKGVYHKSGHNYPIQWWEVLSEMDNGIDIKTYTKIYDASVLAIKKVSPETKFVGLSLNCGPNIAQCSPENMEYFLEPKNHAPGVPIDRISYHGYVVPPKGSGGDQWQQTLFDHADWFIELVKYADALRRRIRPETGVEINEVGCMLLEDIENVVLATQNKPYNDFKIPDLYWNACGAYYAYMFTGLSRLGIDAVKASQTLGYKGQFASVSMLNPETGAPNARYRVLELLANNFRPGDKLVQTSTGSGIFFGVGPGDMSAQAFITPAGKKLLLINKRNRQMNFSVQTGATEANMEVVDLQSGEQKARKEVVRNGKVSLAPFAVAVVSMP